MNIDILLCNETSVRLWGLSSRERIRRVLSAKYTVRFLDELADPPESGSILILRADYLFDNRALHRMSEVENTVLRLPGDADASLVAARVECAKAGRVVEALHGAGSLDEDLQLVTLVPDELVPPFHPTLRKYEPARIYPISEGNREKLERHLFGGAYKGIVDGVTKWVWPIPARWGVRACIRLGLSPNHVTAFNYVLVAVALLLFYAGHFASGLVVAWFMTFLDTVDGKLARVSVSSSTFGHFADHLLDLFHPPFWYLAWGFGLASYDPALLQVSFLATHVIIWVSYIVGRLCEGAFQHGLGHFGIFSWRPIDSYSRLVTARRNPCLVLLTLGTLIGRPDWGLEWVAIWTLLSTLFLLARLGQGAYQRLRFGPLISWLSEIDPKAPNPTLAQRWFARGEIPGIAPAPHNPAD